jgi:hypothetical protein
VVVASTWTVPLVGLAVNGLLAVGSYGIARHWLGQPRGLPRMLATSVVFWTACTVGLETLSPFEAIGVYPMLVWAGIILGLGGMGRWLGRGKDPGVRVEVAETPWSWDAVLCLALVLTAALVHGMPSLLQGVKVVSDGPIYHLYFAARWWKAGRLILVAAPFGENAATYFPANGDLWFTWLMASWGGDGLAKVGQAPFLLLAGAAAYGCARSLGAGRSASLVAVSWFVSSTPLLLYSFEPNVDTIFVAGYLLAAYFLLGGERGGGDGVGRPAPSAALVLGSLAAGLALGTKAIGVVFLPPLIALAIVRLWFQPAPPPTKVIRTAVVALVPMVSGGYWSLRNALLTGNPLYPLEVRWMGQTLLAGWYGPEAMRTSQYYLPFGEWRALCDILLAVLDPRLTPLWIASLIGAWAATNPRTRMARRWIAVFATMAVLNVAIYWVFIPYRTQQRFMLQALGLAVVPLAVILDRSRWLRYAAALLLGLHLLTPQSWPFPSREDAIPWDLTPLIPNAVGALVPLFPRLEPASHARESLGPVLNLTTLGVILAAVLMVWSWSRSASRMTRPWHRRALTSAATLSFLLIGTVVLGYVHVDSRFRFYPPFPDFYRGWLNLEARSGPAGCRVAYAGTNLPYYLLGNGLRNEVRYVNIDRHRDWVLHDYHRDARVHGQGHWPNSRPGWDRLRPDFQAWLDNLDAEGIQLLVVARVNTDGGIHNVADPERFPIERRWAESHSDRFEPLYGQKEEDPWFRLFRVRRPAVTAVTDSGR